MFALEFKTKPTWFANQMALFAVYNYYENVEKSVNYSKISQNLIKLIIRNRVMHRTESFS